MKKIVGLFIIAAFVGLSVLAFTPAPSYALPNFAKKHEASCTLCHTVWPALNRFGEQYFMNGFQMPDTEDGGDVGKIKPDEHVALDSGGANPPLSVRMVIETTLSTTAANDVELIQPNKAEALFFAGGTLGKNLSYFIDNIAAGGIPGNLPEQMWVGIHNVGGAGTANIRYGVINMADFDARPNHRHDLGNGYSHTAASDASTDAVGLQVYGRPGGGALTYQVSLDNRGSGAGAARLGSNTLNPGLLLRGDFGATAVSFHYAGMSDKASFASGAVETKTTSNLISARHVASDFEASLGYGIMSLDVGGAKTDTTGMTLEGIYFTEGYDVQLQFGTNSVKVGGVTTDISQISLKADYHATTNSKMFVKYVGDSSSTVKDGYMSIGTDWAF
ncbi:MAG: hypothetical protein A2Z59_01680 [Nitrospinae bacterium RIFCSPLOWO2_02_39_17]|nr:MAG: hypothetical protein A3D97_02900 [Nitrospinae bacterium RIFCSPHIGHO2_12_FULL_39_42]OGW05552.1 MAG: hypothetical protein A2Z59_01680 [Nitrospinae bacterium RIFCSPLOWO2_02_39_17]OGW11020.1 MAG: hypothetical protein A2W75_08675 [Nitrospinae bacterium RIFCSPLOWO2_12_39_15]